MLMNILLPKTGKRKALYIVDVQPAFLDERNKHIVENITNLLKQSDYDLYITAIFYSKEGDLWEKHRGHTVPKDNDTRTVDEIEELLEAHNPVRVTKQTRSGFRGDIDLTEVLQENNIEEVHIVGTQTNDCIFATAIDAFDSGLYPYVIEECCESSTKELHEMGIALLRRQKMTNHSYLK